MPTESGDVVDALHQAGAYGGTDEAVNAVLRRRGLPTATAEELEAATLAMIEASKAHVRAAGEDFRKALAERLASEGAGASPPPGEKS